MCNTARTAVSLQRWHGKIYLHLRKERQPVLAKPYRVESHAFSSISRQTACTRTVGISREIVRLAAFLREDTPSRGFTRDSRSRMLPRANAINNFGRAVMCGHEMTNFKDAAKSIPYWGSATTVTVHPTGVQKLNTPYCGSTP